MRVVALLRRRRGARAALQPRLVARLALDAHPRAILRGSGAVATAAAPAFAGHAPATAIGLAGGMAPAARCWFSSKASRSPPRKHLESRNERDQVHTGGRKRRAYRWQEVLRTGSNAQRQAIVDELAAGNIGRDCNSVHESHVVQAALRHGTPEQRHQIVDAILNIGPRGNELRGIVAHKFGRHAVRSAWVHASRAQRRQMLDTILPRVQSFAQEQVGRFDLTHFLEHCPDDDDESYRALVGAITPHADDLVCHRHGNHVLRTILELGRCLDAAQGIVDSVIHSPHLLENCSMDPLGSRVVQAILAHGTQPQKEKAIDAILAQDIKPIARNKFGTYVVQGAWVHASRAQRRQMLDTIVPRVMHLAQDKQGRFDLSNFLEHCPDDDDESYRALVGAITRYADDLVCHQHGNHVLRTILELGRCSDAAQGVVDSVIRSALHLENCSMDPYGSHVVQAIFVHGTRPQKRAAIGVVMASEIIDWGDDEYCSHVVKATLEHGTVAQREAIVEKLTPHTAKWGCLAIGNLVVRAALQHGTASQAERIVENMLPHFGEWGCHEPVVVLQRTFLDWTPLLFTAVAWILIPACCFAIP